MELLIVVLFSAVLGDVIPLTLLYEKNDKNGQRYVDIVLRDVVEKYNEELSQTGIEIEVVEVADHSTYSRIPEYKELAQYAGSDDISGRIASLQNIQKNVILLIAAPDPKMAENLSRVAPCNTRLFVDINLEDKVEGVATVAIIKWLKRLLGMNVKDPFQSGSSRKFPSDLRNVNLKERFSRCSEVEYDQNNNGNDKMYFERDKRRTLPNRKRYPDIERSSVTEGRSNRLKRRRMSDGYFNRNSNMRQFGERESFSARKGSGIQLGAPLSILSGQKDGSFNRVITASNNSLFKQSGVEGGQKINKFPLITTPTSAQPGTY